MRNTPNQGLAGKARRTRHRSRASRLHQQHLIEQYLGDDESSRQTKSDRSIRIGHRRDFLPSAELGLDDSGAGQLELPLTTPETIDGGAVMTIPKEKSANLAALEAAAIATQSSPSTSVRDESSVAGAGSAEDEFSLRCLLIGCAMGSAAAAMILMMFRILIF